MSNVCPVCGKEVKSLKAHINRKSDDQHKSYMKKYIIDLNGVLDILLLETKLYLNEIFEKVSNIPNFSMCTIHDIRNRQKEICPERNYKVLSGRRKEQNNPTCQSYVKDKIAKSVKKLWDEGTYSERINGMLSLTGKKNLKYSSVNMTKRQFSRFFKKFQDGGKCARCGTTKKKINIHHIDENHENFLFSNLEPLCVHCHHHYHYNHYKRPYIVITKEASFAACHRLPEYVGACARWHGHEWKFEISIKKRIDPDTHMVVDFKVLKQKINDNIVKILDHGVVNEHLYNPTAENLVVWIWEKLMFKGLVKGIHKIRLWETPTSYATLTEEGMLSIFTENIEKYLERKGPYNEKSNDMGRIS